MGSPKKTSGVGVGGTSVRKVIKRRKTSKVPGSSAASSIDKGAVTEDINKIIVLSSQSSVILPDSEYK